MKCLNCRYNTQNIVDDTLPNRYSTIGPAFALVNNLLMPMAGDNVSQSAKKLIMSGIFAPVLRWIKKCQ